jgi:nucleoside 2-deoxyribosyltransferase
MKIYVASSWRNNYQEIVVKALKYEGYEVYDFKNPSPGDNGFHWSEIDKNWTNWNTEEYIKALNHEIAEKGYQKDFAAMQWADCCVLVLPCGKSAHTEAGWMKGAGKRVYVYIPERQEPELMYKIYDGITGDPLELLEFLKEENE